MLLAAKLRSGFCGFGFLVTGVTVSFLSFDYFSHCYAAVLTRDLYFVTDVTVSFLPRAIFPHCYAAVLTRQFTIDTDVTVSLFLPENFRTDYAHNRLVPDRLVTVTL